MELSNESLLLKQEITERTINKNVEVETVLKAIKGSTVKCVFDNYEIYGNTSMTDREFRNIVIQGNKTMYLLYRTSDKIDLPYDASLYIKINGKTNSYEFSDTGFRDEKSLLTGVKSFVFKYLSKDLNNVNLKENKSLRLMSSVPTTFVDCEAEREYLTRFGDKGYVCYHIAVSRYAANEKSNIYIVTVKSSFTPGAVAKRNGEGGYNGNIKNKGGYVHMLVEQAYDATEEVYYGRRWGNVPFKKDYWPVNKPAVCTINSSLQTGLNLGYSFTNGFSLDNISVEKERNIGANISFGYSKSITRDEPAVSVQVNSSNTNIVEWDYRYNVDRDETYDLMTNYMFEMENSRNGMLIGDFRLKLDLNFTAYNPWFWREYRDNNVSRDLIVRAGEEQGIYNFCNGMI